VSQHMLQFTRPSPLLFLCLLLVAACDVQLTADGLNSDSNQAGQPGDDSRAGHGGTGGIGGTGGTGVGDTIDSAGTGGAGSDEKPATGPDAGSANDGEGTAQPNRDSAWCGALSVFQSACQSCHGTELLFGAPMPLVSYEDTQGLALDQTTPLSEAIGARIHHATSPMPPIGQTPLTSEQLAALDAWVAAGAPTDDDPSCGGLDDGNPGEEVAEFEWPDDCEEFYEFRANDGNGGPYVVGANSERWPKFDFDVPWAGAGEVQALAVRPLTDNARVVHHWILYDRGNYVTGWSPGKEAEVARDGVGIYMPATGQLTLDLHYFNTGNPQAEPDRSGVEMCITRNPRPNTATTYPFAAPATAPANQMTVSENTCTVEADEPIHLLTSSPHMHGLGVRAKLEILRMDGSIDVVHDEPFSADNQMTVPLDDVVIFNGDRIRTTCVYVNNTNRRVTFGNSSTDEMCFNFARFYPMCGMRCTGGNSGALSRALGGGCPD
jgi:cytochrome c5